MSRIELPCTHCDPTPTAAEMMAIQAAGRIGRWRAIYECEGHNGLLTDFCRENLDPLIIQADDAKREAVKLFERTADAVAREMVKSFRLEWW